MMMVMMMKDKSHYSLMTYFVCKDTLIFEICKIFEEFVVKLLLNIAFWF